MSHRAGIYKIRVRSYRKTNEWKLLGDIDEAGKWLGDVVAPGFTEVLNSLNDDALASTFFEERLNPTDDHMVGYSLLSGRSGVTSVIEKAGIGIDRTPEHAETMRTGAMFRLPPNSKEGRLALHMPHGRSSRTAVEKALRSACGRLDLVLDVAPVVDASALKLAVDRGMVEKVTLIKHNPARNDRFADAAQYGDNEVDRIELAIPSGRGRWLKGDPLKKFLNNPSDENRRQIVEFEGLPFDEATVTVQVASGSQRTFYLERPDIGHAMTLALDVSRSDLDRYGLTSDALTRELQQALRDSN